MDKESKSKVEFAVPSGWSPPEHKGDTFDLVCTFRVKGDGKICLVKLGDKEMPGYDSDEKDEPKYKPSYKEYSQSLTSAAPSPTASGGMGGY